MVNILFDSLRPLLDYKPTQVGNAQISLEYCYVLKVANQQWCTLNHLNKELKDFFVEINLAQGDVVTTGLGFGLTQTYLLKKKDVRSLIVYEKNYDVISLFKQTCKQSNFDISRLTIINDDADSIRNIECDWLIMDHFEEAHQPIWEIVDKVRDISRNNNAKNVWFWPIIRCYQHFCLVRNLNHCAESFDAFMKTLNVKNLHRVDESYIKLFHKIPF